jgi:hypothetical protein
MRQLIILAMTSPLWGGFLAIAWQVRKFLRALIEVKSETKP